MVLRQQLGEDEEDQAAPQTRGCVGEAHQPDGGDAGGWFHGRGEVP